MVWLSAQTMANFCISQSMDNLSQYCTQVLDKITPLKLYCIYPTATNHSSLEDQMDYWPFIKNPIQNKPKIFT
jgi:hypothetical protein